MAVNVKIINFPLMLSSFRHLLSLINLFIIITYGDYFFFLHYSETNDEERESQQDLEEEEAETPEVNADTLIGMSNALFFLAWESAF